jgi:hypothetical protein
MILKLISLGFIMVSKRALKALNCIPIMRVLLDISNPRIMDKGNRL